MEMGSEFDTLTDLLAGSNPGARWKGGWVGP